MYKSTFLCVWALLTASAGSASAAWINIDEFDRADGPIDTNWTQYLFTAGDPNFVIDGFQAKSMGDYKALMTHNTYNDQAIRFDVHHSGGIGTESVSAVLAFKDINNYLSVQISSNNGLDNFHSVLFLHVKNGVLNFGWTNIDPPSYFEYLGADSFQDAQITAKLTGDVVKFEIDKDFDDLTPPDLVFERGGVPLGDLGTEVGLAAYGAAKIDNFQGIPEPYTVVLLSVGGIAILGMRRRRG